MIKVSPPLTEANMQDLRNPGQLSFMNSLCDAFVIEPQYLSLSACVQIQPKEMHKQEFAV